MNEEEKIKVLVVDDSALMRALISKMVDSQDDMFVAGKAMNGAFALQKIPAMKPDIIILDIEMPEMNGIEFLKEKERRGIPTPVIILSSIAQKGAKVTFEALSLGASDFITKPAGETSQNIANVADQLCSLIRAYAGKKERSRQARLADAREEDFSRAGIEARLSQALRTEAAAAVLPQEAALKAKPLPEHGKVDIIAIGISTGGPNALRILLSGIKKGFKVPIVIVQHMPEGFTKEFAKSLGRSCPLEVKEAENNDLVVPGRVLIAPGNRHMRLEKKRLGTVVSIDGGEAVNGHRPSAGVLFDSVADVFGSRAMGIIMTGMGKEGAAEIGSIYRAGGFTLAQDESSSVVFGMPRVAIENGFIQKVLPLVSMAEFINDFII